LTQRAYAAALLFAGRTLIHNAGHSADETAAKHVIQQLGASINGHLITSSGLAPIGNTINCGESGLATRLFAPIAALHHSPITIGGTGSLLQRPLEGLEKTMQQFGVRMPEYQGHVPFTVNGPMNPASVTIDAHGSSQLVSGLLFAICASATEAVTITVKDLKSRPYIDMTLDVLAHFGRPVQHERYERFHIDPTLFTHQPQRAITIEADWSSASCVLVAGAITGRVTIPNLNRESRQADKKILEILSDIGAGVVADGQQITVSKAWLASFDTDATDCPDLFPALAVLATACRGTSSIKGLHRLFAKESNRVESITEMLWRYGIDFSAADDTLYIDGRERVQYTHIDGYNDHRIVMAAAVCALRAKGNVTITDAEAINKSYPDFFEHMQQCGMVCELLP
jgi:3-phosphoshikimate 1-carboxyvinyltransferase